MANVIASRVRSARRRLRLLVTAVFLVVGGIMAFGGSTAQAWYCSPNGSRPWQHYSHAHTYVYHQYVDGHTHSWGDHHHIWNVYDAFGFLGQVHYNCGPA